MENESIGDLVYHLRRMADGPVDQIDADRLCRAADEIEQGRSRNPTVKLALGLCEALSTPLNDLLGLDVSQPKFTEDEMALIAAHRAIFARQHA
jgi:transcriptional regulator with XRE-family HTH domain